ncbi:MAG: hypothetical protein JXR51_06775 [Bacteroidales bacterium]|nr:hypothetical protein [Bacteroidales bacterium]
MEIINNQLQVAKIKLAYIVSFVLGIVLLAFAFSSYNFTLEKYFVLIIAILLIIYLIYLIIIKPEYVYFAEGNYKIQIKNYPARPILRKYKAYEIKINDLHHIEVKYSFFKLKIELILWIKTSKGIGKYPALSLSALSKNEKIKLLNYLNKNSLVKQKSVNLF